jgi:hypothetical protein
MATVSSTATISDASGRYPTARHKFVARAGIVVGACAAAAVFLPASLATWSDVDHQQIATHIAPWNAPLAADAAASIGGDPRLPEVRRLVSKALARDTTQVQAIELRALDLALSGHAERARALFLLSDRLSRRSLPTRLWLIQDQVDRGNVAGALRNFDVALRTTTDAQPILFPILARASADQTLTRPLAQVLDRPSDWRLMFINWAIANSADLAPVARVVAQMRDDRFVLGSDSDQKLVERLVTKGEFAQARALNWRFGHAASEVADPNFADSSARYPFGWGLVSNGSIGAERTLSGSSTVLSYRAAPANSGQVAAQLLTLKSGRYVLSTTTAAAAVGGRPYWSVVCADAGGAQLARVDQPMAAHERTASEFTIPPGCSAQWLTLRLRPAADSSEQSGAIASVSVSGA